MTDELEINDSLNVEETLDSNQETNEEVDDTEAKLSKAEEIAKNQRIRAEKAEAELKALKKPQPKVETETPKNEGMSLKDIRALQDVADEDVDEVLDFAKYKGISVAEAKANPVIQTLLKTRQEERATANASSTGNSKKGTKRNSGEEILNNFKQGKVPESDEDIAKLVEAELNAKRAFAKGN